MKVNVFWFRRDLRLVDNTGLMEALNEELPVLPLFIFDTTILNDLPENDARLSFIYDTLSEMNADLQKFQSGIHCRHGKVEQAFEEILADYEVNAVYANKDYEPQAIFRDQKIRNQLAQKGVSLHLFKDQVIFEESEVVKADGKPYLVYTPYMRKWRARLESEGWKFQKTELADNFIKQDFSLPNRAALGFKEASIKVKPFTLADIESYVDTRNIPSLESTSYLGPHLRFGTISIREILNEALKRSEIFVNELIWREFFMQILFHFPHAADRSFKAKYDKIKWLNNEDDFKRWCNGETGYPIVDAGMRELNETGYMHNRVRMITASFLCKHLLIDWRWGEAYFAEKLLDYELSSNNGNWQWVAGSGCDAAPYFRIFNPWEQQKKFDSNYLYIKKWVLEYDSNDYPEPMIDHPFARKRALEVFANGLNS